MTTHARPKSRYDTRPASLPNARQEAIWNGPVGRHWAEQQDRYDAMSGDLNDHLFAAAAIGDGDRVLDVGCGAGTVTRIAARLAGGGRAVGVDISEPLLARARARTAAEGVPNVSYERGDAQTHPFPAGGYDVAISRGGVMFFADHTAAFGNIARALRPGGRLVFACPQPASPDIEESRALGTLASLLGAQGATASPESADARAAMASLSDPRTIRAALAAYTDVDVTALTIETYWGKDPADAVGFLLSRTPEAAVPRVTRKAMEDVLSPYAGGRGVRMKARVWLVTAARPS
ncbi:class I SAM-dependent methyltransferase [Streptomyces lasiicapitis]|uniref:class I SAM-dependent methyltransferase n=1 Tax=Streptomyces lasiicapitis TaxID=1923961 RepID=UPI003657CD4D